MISRAQSLPKYDFSGHRIIVTGAAGGIGRAVVELFLAAGAQVVAADLHPNPAPPHKNRLDVLYDAAIPKASDDLVDTALQHFGGIEHLVLAAGIYQTLPVQNMRDQDWQRMIAVNLDACFYVIRRAVPHLQAGASILAVTSIAAHQGGSFNHAHYGAAKGGLLALVRGLARDLAPHVRVNAVSPGTTDTSMVAARLKTESQAMIQSIPLQRLAQADEIAQTCIFLCSDAASYVTGEGLIVAGGLYMG